MRIMLVDDDALLRDMYATKFSERGDEVEVAETGEEALAKVDKSVFDVILLDMIMPGMSGVDIIKSIKKKDNGQNTACIVLSNQSEQSDMGKASQAGAIGYLIKAELVPSEVVSRVHEIVNK